MKPLEREQLAFIGLIYLQLMTYGFLHGQTLLEVSVKAEIGVPSDLSEGCLQGLPGPR